MYNFTAIGKYIAHESMLLNNRKHVMENSIETAYKSEEIASLISPSYFYKSDVDDVTKLGIENIIYSLFSSKIIPYKIFRHNPKF